MLLAGLEESTDVMANYLASRGHTLVVIVEDPQSRLDLTRRRARRLGWLPVAGQVLFVVLLLPVLRRRGARRHVDIFRSASVDASPRPPDIRVPSVNDDRTIAHLTALRPDVVVVHGTRIVAKRVLEAVACPIINIHAGITQRYRGVHGGYWALREGHPEWVGTTVHLVDPGIDTGGILAQTTFAVSKEDTIATYPDLHLVHGLPHLWEQVDKALTGATLEPLSTSIAPGTGLYHHPTLWGYLWHRWRDRVR